MTMKDDKWTSELRRRMADYETPAPEGVWDSIESTMTGGAAHEPAPRRRFIMPWRYATAAAAMLLIVFVSGWLLLSDSTDTTDIPTPAYSSSSSSYSVLPSPGISHPSQSGVSDSRPMARAKAQPPHTIVSQESVRNLPSPAMTCDTTAATTPADNNPQQQSAPATPPHRPNQRHTSSSHTLLAVTTSTKRAGRLTASAGISNRPGASSSRHGYSGLIAGYSAVETAPDKLPQADNPLCELMRNNMGKEIHTETRHHQPVKAGVSICYSLTERLSLKSGVTYAYLTSSTSSGSDSYRFETDQRLHYIGIPIGLNYTLLQNHRLSLYLSAGASVEKCVSGRLDTDYINNGIVTQSDSERFRPRELQWSATVGAGVQYAITRSIGIYAEPGISYYFDNGSRHETFYTARPLNFNIEAGIRLNIK